MSEAQNSDTTIVADETFTEDSNRDENFNNTYGFNTKTNVNEAGLTQKQLLEPNLDVLEHELISISILMIINKFF